MPDDFEEKQKQLYKGFQPVYCRALQENVYFNADGFNHLIFSNRKGPRSDSERCYRLSLLQYVHQVILKSDTAIKRVKSTKPIVITWALQSEVQDRNGKTQNLKVILIRKKPNGRLYFLSVMHA